MTWIAPRNGGYTPKGSGKPRPEPPEGRVFGTPEPAVNPAADGEDVYVDAPDDAAPYSDMLTWTEVRRLSPEQAIAGPDVIEKAARAIVGTYVGRIYSHLPDSAARDIAQALADAGLLRDDELMRELASHDRRGLDHLQEMMREAVDRQRAEAERDRARARLRSVEKLLKTEFYGYDTHDIGRAYHADSVDEFLDDLKAALSDPGVSE